MAAFRAWNDNIRHSDNRESAEEFQADDLQDRRTNDFKLWSCEIQCANAASAV
ncbi:MAG: hypothetical protein HON53_10620 [Planctomycetaceae bacterium]|nr:hypothetical protein [Planctomycetaceae bacterium]MBT6157040.1 hypothetical protein [Planctomycetaceae bacterium]MBT6484394.1 hypothetical protein [Planctomycetaceae bacterium]MBT6498005.1 hypothetical protein [Planctomycetaceae bacterium]